MYIIISLDIVEYWFLYADYLDTCIWNMEHEPLFKGHKSSFEFEPLTECCLSALLLYALSSPPWSNSVPGLWAVTDSA